MSIETKLSAAIVRHKGTEYGITIKPTPESCYKCPFYMYKDGVFCCLSSELTDHKNIANKRPDGCPLG